MEVRMLEGFERYLGGTKESFPAGTPVHVVRNLIRRHNEEFSEREKTLYHMLQEAVNTVGNVGSNQAGRVFKFIRSNLLDEKINLDTVAMLAATYLNSCK